MIMSYLTTGPLDLTALVAQVSSPSQGGIVSLLGTVRNHPGGREVLRLEYSAYALMAEAECARIVAEAQSRWPVAVALQHRVGSLEIGDAAVAVAVGSAHRDEAFLACRYVIEEVKRRVPIWKREVFADGSAMWVGTGGEAGKRGSGEAGTTVGGEAGKRGRSEVREPLEVSVRHADGTRS
jgi:molybdopterin synthase catalytic subunit